MNSNSSLEMICTTVDVIYAYFSTIECFMLMNIQPNDLVPFWFECILCIRFFQIHQTCSNRTIKFIFTNKEFIMQCNIFDLVNIFCINKVGSESAKPQYPRYNGARKLSDLKGIPRKRIE